MPTVEFDEMHADSSLTGVLACPRCKGPLKDAVAPNALDCIVCRLRYPIEQGIPVLMVSRAVPLEPPGEGGAAEA